MSPLLAFFDCLFPRRFLSGGEAGRAEGEQTPVHQELPSDGYLSEPIPTTGSSAQATSSPSQRTGRRWVRARRVSTNNGTGLSAWEEYLSEHSQAEDEMALENQRPSSRESRARLDTPRPIPPRSIYYSTSGFHQESHSDSDSPNVYCARRDMETRPAAQPAPKLDWSDMNVIRALWHPGSGYVPREIEWDDFVRTMTHLGFGKTETPRGASCRFSVERESNLFPVNSRGNVITVHRPHNRRTTLPIREMRNVGRRMRNAYGWSAETFKST
ncbi:hypothetical protein F4823DRAFT_632400 [Ustulina deusta]|nr:hypothetical protein F4823DRAFT_632400 [Ustulina deusta]